MTTTVALLGATGLLGANLLNTLGRLHAAGKIKLVLVHRASSKIDAAKVPKGADSRVFDFETATEKDVVAALEGVDTVVSALSNNSAEATDRFLEALTKTKISAYIASDYSINWNKEEQADPLNVIVTSKVQQNAKAEQLGLPLVKIHNGFFEPLLFLPPLLGVDIKNNKLALYGKAKEHKVPITSPPYLAEAIAQLVTREPKSLAGQKFTVLEYEASGQDFADALEKVNGAAPTIVPVTEEELDAEHKSGPFGALGAAARRKWDRGDFVAPELFQPEGVQPRTILIAVTEAKARA